MEPQVVGNVSSGGMSRHRPIWLGTRKLLPGWQRNGHEFSAESPRECMVPDLLAGHRTIREPEVAPVIELAVFGVNHKTASIKLRERLAIPRETVPALLEKAVKDGLVTEGLILSTCNRVEIYAGLTGDGDAQTRLRCAVEALLGIDGHDLGAAGYLHTGRAAVEHLFSVACGLDSLVLGENEILGQVREAFADAASAGSTGPIFNRLFHQALRVGKRARSESSIASGITSLPSAAIHVLGRHFGSLRGRHGVLLGAGAMAGLAASHLAGQGLADLVVVNRTASRAECLAASCGGRAIPLDGLLDAVAATDFVLAACTAPGHLVTAAALALARQERRHQQPLVAVDLSVPRVIDPALGSLDGVTVHDLDALDRLLESHRTRRSDAVHAVKALVVEEAGAFLRWCREREAVSPLLTLLTTHCDTVRRQVVERNAKFLAGAEADQVDRLARSLIAKLLDRPFRQIKSWDPDTPEGRARLEVVRELFGLDEEGSDAVADVLQRIPALADSSTRPRAR
jgi:glutamyl-tRNA reductase